MSELDLDKLAADVAFRMDGQMRLRVLNLIARCRAVGLLIGALEALKHDDGCYCEAAFAGPGCHPRHSPECEAACEALAAAKPPEATK